MHVVYLAHKAFVLESKVNLISEWSQFSEDWEGFSSSACLLLEQMCSAGLYSLNPACMILENGCLSTWFDYAQASCWRQYLLRSFRGRSLSGRRRLRIAMPLMRL